MNDRVMYVQYNTCLLRIMFCKIYNYVFCLLSLAKRPFIDRAVAKMTMKNGRMDHFGGFLFRAIDFLVDCNHQDQININIRLFNYYFDALIIAAFVFLSLLQDYPNVRN